MTPDPILIAESHEDDTRHAIEVWEAITADLIAVLGTAEMDSLYDRTRDKYAFEAVN